MLSEKCEFLMQNRLGINEAMVYTQLYIQYVVFCEGFIKITNHKKMHSHVKAKQITTDCY